MIPLSDQRVELFGGHAFVEIDELKVVPSRLEVLLRLSACGSSRFRVEGDGHIIRLSVNSSASRPNARAPGRRFLVQGSMTYKEQAFQCVRAGDLPRLREVLDKAPEVAGTKDSDGLTLLLFALYRGRRDMATELRELRPRLDLFEAAALGETEALEKHLGDAPALVGALSTTGLRLLHVAAYFGQRSIVRLLLAHGADPNAPSSNALEMTPLHCSAGGGHLAVTTMLLRAGADPNARRTDGITVLHAAAMTGNAKLVAALLEAGAGSRDMTRDGKTAADLAAERGYPNIADTLLRITA